MKIIGKRIIRRAKDSTKIIKKLEFNGVASSSFEYECDCGIHNVLVEDYKGPIFTCIGCGYSGELKLKKKPKKPKKIKKPKTNKSEK